MSRSGYSDSDDFDYWELNLYRANVERAISGKRGQAFLRELIAALDALPEKKLISESLADADGVCALGSVARSRGITDKVVGIDPESAGDGHRGGSGSGPGKDHRVAYCLYHNDLRTLIRHGKLYRLEGVWQ